MEKKLKYSKDGLIVFRDSDHSYTFTSDGEKYKKGEKLVSVTTIIGQYCPPFDPTGEITAKYAEEMGLSVEEVQNFWRIDNHIANVYGTAVHSVLENYIVYGEERVKYKYRWILDAFKTIPFQGKLFAEKLLYSDKYKIAGQCDLTEVLPNKKIRIHDFKTNKELLMKNEFGNTMLGDLWYLDDSSYQHYKIQLSIYARLYEMQGMEIEDLNIIYFNRWIKKMEVYTFQPMKKEVDIILNNRLLEIESDNYIPTILKVA